MTEDVDRALAALFAEPAPPPDAAFAERIVALARYDQALAEKRRAAFAQVIREAAALGAVLVSFVLLARMVPDGADMGDAVPLGSPAMIALALLGLWALVGSRPATA